MGGGPAVLPSPGGAADEGAPAATRVIAFSDLPPEIHLAISRQLTYPDALSLKHTCRYFYQLVDTGVKLKVAWLVERHTLHLECPNDRCCDLRSDGKFCRGSVRYVFLVSTTAFLFLVMFYRQFLPSPPSPLSLRAN